MPFVVVLLLFTVSTNHIVFFIHLLHYTTSPKTVPPLADDPAGIPPTPALSPGQFSTPALPSCEQRSPQPSKHDQKLPPQADKLPSARLATGQAWCKSASYTAGEYNNHSLCE
jgi:hypothetical protein